MMDYASTTPVLKAIEPITTAFTMGSIGAGIGGVVVITARQLLDYHWLEAHVYQSTEAQALHDAFSYFA